MYARDFALIATPIGMVRVSGDDDCVAAVAIEAEMQPEYRPEAGALAAAARQLVAYFNGRLTVFDLPLAPLASPRGTAMRDAMIAIPFGETLSYGALARTIGSGARAIGQACARNPMPILVPCHRVTNADGSLRAYSGGGGKTTKRWLLDHERPAPTLFSVRTGA